MLTTEDSTPLDFADILDEYLIARDALIEAKRECSGHYDGVWREDIQYDNARKALNKAFASLKAVAYNKKSADTFPSYYPDPRLTKK